MSALTAHDAGLVACRECGRLAPRGQAACGRCGAHLSEPDMASLQSVWAFLVTGMMAYVPANLLPMLITRTLGREQESTIVGGAVELMAQGSWFVAAIILVASVVIPLAKFGAIAWLALAIRGGWARGQHARHRLHQVVELIGRWSMIDVFVVALLAALVQLGFLAEIEPGPAAAPFALSVALTMLAAQRLDARLIWREERP